MNRIRRTNELFLEDAAFDDIDRNLERVDLPVSRSAFVFVMAFTFFIAFVVLGRVLFFGFGKGDFYIDRAQANMADTTLVPAERGIIFDRFAKPLVRNAPSFQAVVRMSDFFRLSLAEQDKQLYDVASILDIEKEDLGKLMQVVDLEKQNEIVLAKNLTIDQVAQIKTLNFNAFQVTNDFSRVYENSYALSHILGYVGLASPEDLRKDATLLLNDAIGKSGVELFYDSFLRGQYGELVEFRNARNESLGQRASLISSRGNSLSLAVDLDLQAFFYERLVSQLASLERVSGVGIVMKPHTGEVLALVSVPGFDGGNLTSEMLIDSKRPLFNRAVSGVYNPGSTIKPLVAAAALQEKIVDPLHSVYSAGFIEIPNPYHPDQPSRFVDWKPHGWVNLYSALARSSNIYFYAVGGGYDNVKGLGVSRLKKYWEIFGLGEKTGIDLPGEKTGFLPDAQEREKRTGLPWRLGDTYNVSIGQGDLMITPIELINYISSISTRGILYKPQVVKKITTLSGETIKEFGKEKIKDFSYLKDSLDEVEAGMLNTVDEEYGTAHLLHSLPFKVAGKTGSAQIEWNKKVNAFFVGYGPVNSRDVEKEGYADEDQIAVLVLIEDAREGSSNTVPVANDVFRWYYDNRLSK